MSLLYSNPRMHAEIANWPMGGSHRGTATFTIETRPGKGERAIRVTRRDDGKQSAGKMLTFALRTRIVDGDDGKTYLACLTEFGHVSIHQSNMQFSQEAIFPADPRYAAVRALFVDEPAEV